MTDFNASDHPRAAAGTFTDKQQSAPDVTFTPSLAATQFAAADAAYEEAARKALATWTEADTAAIDVTAAYLRLKFPGATKAMLYADDNRADGRGPLLGSVTDAAGEELADDTEEQDEALMATRRYLVNVPTSHPALVEVRGSHGYNFELALEPKSSSITDIKASIDAATVQQAKLFERGKEVCEALVLAKFPTATELSVYNSADDGSTWWAPSAIRDAAGRVLWRSELTPETEAWADELSDFTVLLDRVSRDELVHRRESGVRGTWLGIRF
jgi:hypothetical protein